MIQQAPAPSPAAPDARQALFDGATGQPMTTQALLGRASGADVVAFGELHGHLVGAEFQLHLLRAMHASGRPVALAMEFLERDVQPVVDQYLRGEIDEATFRKEARQNAAYPKTHGPLIEFCKANGLAVIAANAPRPLVTAYRKSEADYATYLDSLTDEERVLLPRSTSTPDGPYKDRFYAFMGPKRAATFFRSQSLWDDAMAEAVTDWREAHPDTSVLLIVGGFHVGHQGGTVVKIRSRRPNDRVFTVVMGVMAPPLTFESDDQGVGDVSLKVAARPKKGKAPAPKP